MRKQYISRLIYKRGRYGKTKCKAFKVLSSLPKGKYLDTRQLCIYSGIPYGTLASALFRWTDYGYVKRSINLGYGGDYLYRITGKGKSWLELARQFLPNYQVFANELTTWRNSLTKEYVSKLLHMRFVDFVETLRTDTKYRVAGGSKD